MQVRVKYDDGDEVTFADIATCLTTVNAHLTSLIDGEKKQEIVSESDDNDPDDPISKRPKK